MSSRTQSLPTAATTVSGRSAAIERYYRFHSVIYDATRWSFLFGRTRIIREIGAAVPRPKRILEVGCGTGKNLLALAKAFPEANITGLDLSSAMLDLARKKTARFGQRVQHIQQKYDRPLHEKPEYDVVLFSYALSMFNPGWEIALDAALKELKPDGIVAVVDFHDSQFKIFQGWMGVNHVRMEGHLRKKLLGITQPVLDRVETAYAGVWRYHLYLGKNR